MGGRTADPYRDLDVIDSREPRFNQSVIGTLALAAFLLGAATLGWAHVSALVAAY